jgi:outer membrane receptor for ferrienterochelin and colicin
MILAFLSAEAYAEEAIEAQDSTVTEIQEVVVTGRKRGSRKLLNSAENSDILTSVELTRAACCNLGESFTTNPSVDVSYGDAATGARQIKLLGLSGTYVQMLTENVPNFRGAAIPYGLGYLAGPWMHSIQISKGASSVKNGYESITGQINIEMLKPQNDQSITANLYGNQLGKMEGNVMGNIHLNSRWSTGLLLHGENAFANHDENKDGFIDSPAIRQLSAMNRWAYMSPQYIFQAGVKFLYEKRESGQDTKHSHASSDMELYKIGINTRRWEAFAKNAYIFNPDNGGNMALILSGSLHDQDAGYGHKVYDVLQKNFYASLMYEQNYGDWHQFSAGLSFNYDYYNQQYRMTQDISTPLTRLKEIENVPGVYAQYTFNRDDNLLLMAGMRYDYSSLFGAMLTPRFHARYNVLPQLSLHASAGRGYHNPHFLAENNYLFASSRNLLITDKRMQESAWNIGGGITSNLTLFGNPLTLSGEYYYTRFTHQAVIDFDTDAHTVRLIYNNGHSYSHTLQMEVSYQPIKDMTLALAYRYTDVKENYGYGLVQKPLMSKSKGLFTFGYTPMMGIWQFDASFALNGKGRMPTPYTTSDGTPSWRETYKPYPLLNMQITRNFRHWSIYVGGENLTNYKQKNPIINASNPWGEGFDATMIYASVHGAMVYVGFKYNFTKY